MHDAFAPFSLETGVVEWEVGGCGPKTPADLLGVIFFLGHRLVLGNSLFVLADQKQEIRLLCLRTASGEVRWSQSLGMPRDKIVLDFAAPPRPRNSPMPTASSCARPVPAHFWASTRSIAVSFGHTITGTVRKARSIRTSVCPSITSIHSRTAGNIAHL